MNKYYKPLLIFLILFRTVSLNAQDRVSISIKNTTISSSGRGMPFWFTANQNGKIDYLCKLMNISDLYMGRLSSSKNNSSLSYKWGGNLIAAVSNKSYLQINQLFAGVALKGWELKAGMFHDLQRYSGLSTTNGNMARSLNARPVPMVRFSTNTYKPFPFLNNILSFRTEYDEGILNDDRFVDNAHLHHKSVYIKIHPADKWDIQVGIDHFVMWGGKSQDNNIGKMPSDLKAYFRYITGSSGNDQFPATDQLNVAGNQLGTYTLEINKSFKGLMTSLYINHPFEDFSGVNLRNLPDNLLGIHMSFDNNKFIKAVNYEYTNTRQQSIRDSIYIWNESSHKWQMKENDNYFSHGIYKSGFTYHQKILGSPLFFPLISDNGIIKGIRSNRFYSHHLGIKGVIGNNLTWKGLATYTHHLGTYAVPFETGRQQLSAVIEIGISSSRLPFELGTAVGMDFGNIIQTNTAIQFFILKRITK